MSEKETHTIRNGIIVTVIGGIILSVIPPLRNFVLKVLSWFWAGIIWVWEILISSYSIQGWILLILGFVALVGVIKIYFTFRPAEEPEYKKYTEDFIYGVKWRWSWVSNTISNLWCFCPECDNELVYDDSSSRSIYTDKSETKFICERCNRRVVTSIEGGNIDYAKGAVEREIRRKLRTGEKKGSN